VILLFGDRWVTSVMRRFTVWALSKIMVLLPCPLLDFTGIPTALDRDRDSNPPRDAFTAARILLLFSNG
jgi:hypothetical protein